MTVVLGVLGVLLLGGRINYSPSCTQSPQFLLPLGNSPKTPNTLRWGRRAVGESGAKRLHPPAYINLSSVTASRLTTRALARTVLNSARKDRLSTYQATAYLARSFKHLQAPVCRQCASWGTC